MSVKRAAIINALGKYSKIFLSIIVNAVLARILSAEDYGVVAVITVFSVFFTTFSDMGFGPAIIQNKKLTREDINNIFSLTVYIALFLMIVFALSSYAIAWFYDNDVYVSLGYLLSISLLFSALNMVPNGILNREKRFVSIAIRTVFVYVIAAVITIVLAKMGFKYYSLAIQSILSAFFTFIWNYRTTTPRFRFKIDRCSITKILNYSSYQFGFNIINYFSRNLDNLLTGKFMGTAELGYYNKAYSLMLYPVNNLTGIVSPVLHPLLSDYQDHLEIIYRKYLKIVRLLACIGIYVAPTCYLAANEIIEILYGHNWGASVKCFGLLSIAIIPQMINSSAGSIFQAIGNTKLLFINSCINTMITVLAILIGIFVGKDIETLSLCIAIAYLFHFVTAFMMLIKYGFKLKFFDFVKELFPEMIVLGIMITVTVLYPFSVPQVFASLFVKVVYLGIFWVIGLMVSKEYRLIFSVLNKP